MKPSKSTWIINGFALLHAVTAVVCRLIGVDDSLILTLMTMLMAVWLCLGRGYSLEITAACVILVNVVGYLLGTGGARLLNLMNASRLLTYPISTFVTTELLGWGIVLLTRLFRASCSPAAWRSSIRWVAVAFVLIIILRFGFVESIPYIYGSSDGFIDTVTGLFSNISVLLLIICANIIYARFVHRWHFKNDRIYKVLILIAYSFVLTLLVSLLDVYNFPFLGHDGPLSLREFAGVFMLALIVHLTVYSVIYIISYAISAGREREEARMRAQEVQFQYVKLKQQISPHFFFNSLNSLDCLVCEGHGMLASEYIHKLAGIYRYMLGRGEEELVKLREEMTFVDMYVDMMKLRYGRGLVVRTDIGEEAMGRMVVPCSVQLLIENAVKHNIVSEEDPMTVDVVSSADSIAVSNRLKLRLTPSSEGGHGLTYVTKIYENLCDRPVLIRQTGGNYVVTLPLI